jgi:hypothetical protein
MSASLKVAEPIKYTRASVAPRHFPYKENLKSSVNLQQLKSQLAYKGKLTIQRDTKVIKNT